ncbi:MAG: glycosyltransferase family 2 protein [Candidatus Doudnabacteria bacterium]|nr:glycosyltransferase family 2 protein [Candidatus Doudnabacteria bacterium]
MIKRSLTVRALEIFPGVLTWVTLIGAPVLSYFHPAWVSVYIILFDLYWFLKGANVAIHLMHSHRRLKMHNKINWLEWSAVLNDLPTFLKYLKEKLDIEKKSAMRQLYLEHIERLESINDNRSMDWTRIYHLVILPIYQEGVEVLEPSISSYCNADYPTDHIIMVLAVEERAGAEATSRAESLKQKFKDRFHNFFIITHPDGLVGEARGKGANCAYAAEKVSYELKALNIPFENVIVSNFDCDTTVAKNYFAHLTFDFMTIDKPHQASYQPMPVFHNNIWDTPAVARVIAISSSFWQLVEASRPDRLVTFSSHSMSFKTLVDIGFWRRDLIPEDSYVFWQCFLHYNGDYRTHPLFTFVSMDAVLGDSYVDTLIAQYKQKRRWAWGAIQISLVFPQFYHNDKIPLWKRLLYGYRMVEGYYFWATASIMIAILGWLPLIFGGDRFGNSVLALNLPLMTRAIMSIATFFLIFSVYVSLVMLPKRPDGYSRWKSFSMIWQWIFSPIVSSVFGSFPAIDAQTRLMFGKYMEFWVTPKIRKQEIKNVEQVVINK